MFFSTMTVIVILRLRFNLKINLFLELMDGQSTITSGTVITIHDYRGSHDLILIITIIIVTTWFYSMVDFVYVNNHITESSQTLHTSFIINISNT